MDIKPRNTCVNIDYQYMKTLKTRVIIDDYMEDNKNTRVFSGHCRLM
jgi:hypothetical protein